MLWTVTTILTLTLIITSLRYLTLAQNNGYALRFNRKLVEYYALTVILILPILILGIVYKFYPVIEIEYGLLALSILNLVAILLHKNQ